MKKMLRYFKIGYGILLLLMVTAWLVRYSMLGGNKINPKVEGAIIEFAGFPSKVAHLFKSRGIDLKDRRHIPNSNSRSGISYYVDTSKLSPGYLLISTFNGDNEPEIKLLDLKKNIFIKKWDISADTLLHYTDNKELERNAIRLMHPLLLKDSSLIFNTGYSLIKINKTSHVLWSNKKIFHHSIEFNDDTSVWTCGRIVNKKPLYIVTRKDTLINDAIALVNSNNGKIIFQKSVYDILNENGYRYLFAIGNFENDAFHLNEVNPAKTDTKYWKKGDLLISLRHRSTVFLYRPSANKILWLKTGPWSNQHSPTFLNDESIMVLGNDMIRSNDYAKMLYPSSNIYIYNLKNGAIDTSFNKVLRQLKVKALSEGRCNILPNGDVFFCDTNHGRVYIFDRDKLKLMYCERIDDKYIKMMNLVRYISK
jgi:hypothetical protein